MLTRFRAEGCKACACVFRETEPHRLKEIGLKLTAEHLVRQESRGNLFVLRLLLSIAVPQVKGQSGDLFARTGLPAVGQGLRADTPLPPVK